MMRCPDDVREPRHYQAFGLKVRSRLPLVELPSVEGAGAAEIEIDFGAVPETLPGRARGIFTAVGERALMWIPGVARYLLQAGRTVTIGPEPGATEDDLRAYLLTMVFGALLHQRDELVLHGSAVAIRGKAVGFLGFSGQGKSTLAAGFRRRGHPVLTDDLCLVRPQVDGVWAIQPSFPHMKLWLDSLEKLELSAEGLRRIRHKEAKRALPLGEEFAREPLPVEKFYLLRVSERSEPALRRLDRTATLAAFRNQTYRPGLLALLEQKPRQFEQMLALAKQVSVTVLDRPTHGFHLGETISLIEADLGA